MLEMSPLFVVEATITVIIFFFPNVAASDRALLASGGVIPNLLLSNRIFLTNKTQHIIGRTRCSDLPG